MSVHEPTRRVGGSDAKVAILETVLRRNNVRLSALVESLSLDANDARELLLELRDAELVSACRLDEDDLVVTSLPRLREYERTKLHRLVCN
jgi:transcription initiation factor IIE alpha subunit